MTNAIDKLDSMSMSQYANGNKSPLSLLCLSQDEAAALLSEFDLDDELEFDEFMNWLFRQGHFKLTLDPTRPIEDWCENVMIEFLPNEARLYQFDVAKARAR